MTTGHVQGQRKRRASPRALTVGALLGIVALIGAVIWSSMTHAGQPAEQQRVAMPGMGEHFVNLWVEEADRGGGRRLTAQVTDVGGWPEPGVTAVTFSVTGPGQPEPVESPGMYSPDGPGRGQVYSAVVNMGSPGTWEVVVRFVMSRETGEASFTVDVD